MRILSIDQEPLVELACILPLARGAKVDAVLPVFRGYIEGLPIELDALIVASDLQAREASKENRAIGVVLAETLSRLLPSLKVQPVKTGVLLAGDLYTSVSLHRRFGVGLVDEVWDAFADQFRWVTGVLGNVDRLSTAARKTHKLLETKTVVLDDLCIGGVSGIIGAAKMENRRSEAEVLRDIRKIVKQDPELLLLHEGPSIPGSGYPGSHAVRTALGDYAGLVLCGHNQWPVPMATLRKVTVINSDSRCLVLTR